MLMSEYTGIDVYRRRFLGNTAKAAAGLAVVTPAVFLHEVGQARPADQPVTSQVRWGMLIDSGKCADGCDDCVTACKTENGWTGHNRPLSDPQWIRKVKLRDKETGYTQTLPMLCQHCEYPPCVDVCPTGASFKRADGIVLVDKHICIGCRYCMMACPYKARSFVHEDIHDQKPYAPRGKGTVESCTFCVQRVDSNRTPACVEACTAHNHGAMVFGDMNDPDSEISRQLEQYSSRQIRGDLQLNTGVRYRGI
jgi:molybdopterin-containing oxidoreductase family iron-sulfur binding subunit